MLEEQLDSFRLIDFFYLLVASALKNDMVQLWDQGIESCHNMLEDHLDCIWAIVFLPDSQLVASIL